MELASSGQSNMLKFQFNIENGVQIYVLRNNGENTEVLFKNQFNASAVKSEALKRSESCNS